MIPIAAALIALGAITLIVCGIASAMMIRDIHRMG